MWQYKQVPLDRNASLEQRQEVLDKLGREGFELKSTHPFGLRNEVMVFARPIAEEAADPEPKPSDPKPLLG